MLSILISVTEGGGNWLHRPPDWTSLRHAVSGKHVSFETGLLKTADPVKLQETASEREEQFGKKESIDFPTHEMT